jgi:rod shape-determining protein MreD
VKTLAICAFALVLMAVQAAVLRYLGGGAWPLALVVPCVVYLALNAGNLDGPMGAAALGYLMDLWAGAPKGQLTFLAVLLFLVVRVVGASLDVRTWMGFALLCGIATACFDFSSLALTRLISEEATPGASLIGRVLFQAALTGICSPAVFAGMRRIDRLFTREEPGLLR